MVAGVGIIGALASILASLLVPQPASPEDRAAEAAAAQTLQAELTAIKNELAGLRRAVVAGHDPSG